MKTDRQRIVALSGAFHLSERGYGRMGHLVATQL